MLGYFCGQFDRKHIEEHCCNNVTMFFPLKTLKIKHEQSGACGDATYDDTTESLSVTDLFHNVTPSQDVDNIIKIMHHKTINEEILYLVKCKDGDAECVHLHESLDVVAAHLNSNDLINIKDLHLLQDIPSLSNIQEFCNFDDYHVHCTEAESENWDLFDTDSTKRAQRIQEREKNVRVSHFYSKQKPEHITGIEHDGKEKYSFSHIQCINDLDFDASCDDGPIIPIINSLEKARKLVPNIGKKKKPRNENKSKTKINNIESR